MGTTKSVKKAAISFEISEETTDTTVTEIDKTTISSKDVTSKSEYKLYLSDFSIFFAILLAHS